MRSRLNEINIYSTLESPIFPCIPRIRWFPGSNDRPTNSPEGCAGSSDGPRHFLGAGQRMSVWGVGTTEFAAYTDGMRRGR
jgi:hypothetical protein